MSDIVVLGSLNMDLVVQVARMPVPGQTIPGGDLHTISGGKGANQAAAAGKLGGRVSMVGRVGGDAFGQRLKEGLQGFGVDVSHVRQDSGSVTGTAVIIVEETGENVIVISPGANGRVGEEDIRQAEGLISQARVLLLQHEVPMGTVEKAVQLASRNPVKIILNPAPAQPISAEILAKIDILVPNETEAALLTSIPVSDLASAGEAARKLLGLGVRTVIITLGDQGALLATGEQILHIPTVKVKAVDTTAAGDAFIGGLANALLKDLSLKDAVRYANCAGALAATKFGAQTSLPSAEEVQSLFETSARPDQPQT
jgi:ribokinase